MQYIHLTLLLAVFLLPSCHEDAANSSTANDKMHIEQCLDRWHAAAASANLESYFSEMTNDAIFIGTDAKERWNMDSFRVFCKPYFDRGKAWNFKPMQRHIMIDSAHHIAWMDELLITQMKICRGSAVLRKEKDKWKIAHYVLSMTIPNECTDTVVALKRGIEDSLIQVSSESNHQSAGSN